jgi:CBS domain-containing protein
VVGIISERDISRFLSIEKFDLNKKISEIMTKNTISCDLKISVSELMETMTNKKIRHMPIIDQNKLVGIVSIGDVVNHIIQKYEVENDAMRNYINGYS